MQDRAEIVIVGAGIAGGSIAYHLAEIGKRDVVVLEQGELISGTTSHAPGLVGQLRSDESLTRLLMYSVSLYRNLRVDGAPGYFSVGSVRLASSPARFAEIKRQEQFARKVGLEASLLTPAEAQAKFPLMNLAGVEGALFLPTDGSATAPLLARALIGGAAGRGVSFHARTRVESIDVKEGRVRAVVTSKGRIETETLVIATGVWSPVIGRLAGVSLPLTPMQHQYAMTVPLPELAGQTVANLRDPDKLVYFRQNGDSLVVGGYERDPRPFRSDQIPERVDPTVQTFDARHFESLRRAAAERVPLLATAAFSKQVNGLESFTPDGEFLLGPAPEVAGIWAACGFCAHGISGAGGVGRALAQWIVNGDPGLDLSHMSLDRFRGKALDVAEIERQASRLYATYYDMSPQ